ncbi:MAG TPA: flagellin [Bryobacteraceae bacterium]|nr:flagellin [Bryobacteraceae bacterium]
MSISIQTNVTSLMAQENLSVNSAFESQTIQRLTSGFKINSSGDDAAGLAVANQYRADISELTQGVQNANNGVSTLQIVDGGLNNISTMMDRMKTLAAESASGTFTGSRATLDTEYQQLVSEITRQAANINLNAGGTFNTNLQVYIGGGRTSNVTGSSQISVDLSGAANAVDAASLGLQGTSVLGGGTSFASNAVKNLNDPNAKFDVKGGGAGAETFAITYLDANGAVQTQTVSVNAVTGGMSGSAFVSSLNNAISTNATAIPGVTAQIGSDGSLQFGGGNLLQVVHGTSGTAPTSQSTNGTSLSNGANYATSGAFVGFLDGTTPAHSTENLVFTAGGQNYNVTLTSDTANATQKADTIANAVASLNTQLKGSGITAYQVDATNIGFQGAASFTAAETANTPDTGGAGSLFGTTIQAETITAPSPDASATGNAQSALTAINTAISQLGLTQGKVGAGENKLNYAISLAQSQISSFSSAQSQIRDADVAAEAANLSKAQVLQQSSVAALVQANAMPQAVLALLKG